MTCSKIWIGMAIPHGYLLIHGFRVRRFRFMLPLNQGAVRVQAMLSRLILGLLGMCFFAGNPVSGLPSKGKTPGILKEAPGLRGRDMSSFNKGTFARAKVIKVKKVKRQ